MSERTMPRHHHRSHHQGQPAGDHDPRREVAELIDAAAIAVSTGASARARALLDAIAAADPVHRSPELAATVVADAIARRRATAMAGGWTEEDLAELEHHRLRVPAAASALERQVRRLGLLWALPPLPPVAPRRGGHPGADPALLAKVRALLAKAESTTFPDEAEALSAKAQELMARHRLDRVLVEAGPGRHDLPAGRRIWLHHPYADARFQLLGSVAGANRCQAVWLGGIDVAHVIGYPADLDVVELLHTSLLVQATRAIAAAGPQVDERGRSRTRSFRRSFLLAYAWRIGERLRTSSAAAEATADAGSGSLLPVLAQRDAEVEAAVATAFPNLRRTKVSVSNGAGWAAGTAAADAADLADGARLGARPPRAAPGGRSGTLGPGPGDPLP